MQENKIHQLVRDIAGCMGFEWHYSSEQEYNHGADISGPEGSGLFVRVKSGFADEINNPNCRLTVTGEWPEQIHAHGQTYSFRPYEDKPEISVSASRAPTAIAKDILRRFVPKYLPMWRETAQRRERLMQSLDLENQLLAQLAEAGDLETSDRNNHASFPYNGPHSPNGSATISTYQDIPTVKLDVHGIPFDVALKVVALLRESQLSQKRTK